VAVFALSSVFSFPKLSKKKELGVRAKYLAGGIVPSVERSWRLKQVYSSLLFGL
jgi:hypothetical protein